MTVKSIKYYPEVDTQEHDDSTVPETKRVSVYGWDSTNLRKVKLGVNSDGGFEQVPTKGLNPSIIVSESVAGDSIVDTITKTINGVVYTKTVSADLSGNTVTVSGWTEA